MISIKLYQIKNKLRPDGTATIYYVLSKDSKRKYISTKTHLLPKHFDNVKGVVSGGSEKNKLNPFFQLQLGRLQEIVRELISDKHEPSFEKVEARFNNNTGSDFITFALSELEKEKGTREYKTYKGYKNRLENLKKFQETIPFNSITHDFLTTLKQHFIRKNRKTNGYYQDFAVIKKFYRIAVSKGYAKGNPFENFVMETEDTVRSWLMREELKKLGSLLEGDKITDAEKNTLRHFLFSCYSGIRFGDKKAFNADYVVDGKIQFRQGKTNNPVVIPFIAQTEALLPYILARKLKQSGSRVNKDLKNCMKQAGIQKVITFHSSRHTFAVNSIMAGVDIITVRDWLGHTSVTTTEVYAKIAATHKDQSGLKLHSYLTEIEKDKNKKNKKIVPPEIPHVDRNDLIAKAVELKAQGLTNLAIAKHFNVSNTTIKIWLRKANEQHSKKSAEDETEKPH